jgi:hypothetical protein
MLADQAPLFNHKVVASGANPLVHGTQSLGLGLATVMRDADATAGRLMNAHKTSA